MENENVKTSQGSFKRVELFEKSARNLIKLQLRGSFSIIILAETCIPISESKA